MKARPDDLIERAIATDDWGEARKLIRHELERNPESHWLWSRLALTYYEQRQYRRALHYDIKALQLAPYCPLAIWGYAGSLDMLERYKEALQIYRRLAKWDEKDLAHGECGEGLRWARSLIADCHYRIALIWERRGQRKRAFTAFEEYFSPRRRGAQSIYNLREVKARYKRLKSQKQKG